MNTSELNSNIKAELSLIPKRSQINISLILIIAAFTLFTSFYFMWNDKSNWYVPFLSALILFLVAFLFWWKTQPQTDLESTHPTIINSQSGTQLSCDSKLMESNTAMTNLSALLESLGAKKPLPAPAGMIDSNGSIVEGSKKEAERVAKSLNDINEEQVSKIQNALAEEQEVDIKLVNNIPIDKELESRNGVMPTI